MQLGALIRKNRRAKELTIQKVACSVGYSVSYISSVERGIISPSAEALQVICRFLEIDLDEVLNEETEKDSPAQTALVVRKNQRKRFAHPNSNVSYELISPDFRHGIELLKATAKPGERAGNPPFSHQGEEVVLILKGKVEMHVGEDIYILEEGDSIYITDSWVPHYWVAAGDEEVQLYGCVVPPSF